MYKKILTLIIIAAALLIFPSYYSSNSIKNIHALLILEDKYTIPGFNKGSQKRVQNLYRMQKLLSYLQRKKILRVRTTVIRGHQGTRKNILNALNKIEVNKNGILMVYFSGHGGVLYKENGDTFVYTRNGDIIYRGEIERILYQKKCRFKIMITDNGSKVVKSLPRVMSNYSRISEKKKISIYKNLFYNYKGLFHISAATEGQDAHPSYFTRNIVSTLMYNPKNTWKKNFNVIKYKTVQMAHMDGKRQTPKIYVEPSLITNTRYSLNQITVRSGTPRNDGDIMVYQKSTKPNPIYICIMGDGYIKQDLTVGGDFQTEATRLAEFFLSHSPFKEYREYFTVYFVFVESKQRGADSSPNYNSRNTALNSTYGASGIRRLLVIQNYTKAYQYAERIGKRPHSILISINDKRHGGSGGSVATASRTSFSTLTMLHELGHTFGGVADEYTYGGSHYPLSGARYRPNVDTNSNLHTIKWARFIGKPGFEKVGAYEGGYYRPRGVWRPEKNCIMKSLTRGIGFCAVCQEAIVKKICNYCNIRYSFSDFLRKKKNKDHFVPDKKDQNIHYNSDKKEEKKLDKNNDKDMEKNRNKTIKRKRTADEIWGS